MAAVLERPFACRVASAVRVPLSLAACLFVTLCSAGGYAAVDPQVWEAVRVHGQSDVFVVLPDANGPVPPLHSGDKQARGRSTYDRLRRRADVMQTDLLVFLERRGATGRGFSIANVIHIEAADAALIEALGIRQDVVAVIPDRSHYQARSTINHEAPTSSGGTESNLRFVGAQDVWKLGVEGQGIVLGAIDGGLQWDHPALRDQYRGWNGSIAEHDRHWWDATGQHPLAPAESTARGQGTHATGVMVGRDRFGNRVGLAPRAKAIHCKAVSDQGEVKDSWLLTCLQFMLAPWNLSGEGADPDRAPDAVSLTSTDLPSTSMFTQALAALRSAGILVTRSVGDNGPACGSASVWGGSGTVIHTGSVAHTGLLAGVLSSFSGRGPSTEAPGTYLPGILAPGENVRSTSPRDGFNLRSGTDVASPHVAALAGLMWQANPSLRGDVARTEQLIYATAVPLSGQTGSACGGDYAAGPNHDWGHGTLDALAAVQAAISADAAPGTVHGIVTDAGSGAALEGVAVSLGTFEVLTDEAGRYRLTRTPGHYALAFRRAGYLGHTIPAVPVTPGVTIVRDVALHGSVLSHAPASFDQVVAPGTVVRRQLTLTNTGAAPLPFALRVRRGPSADASAISLDAGEAWGVFSWPDVAQTMFIQFPDIGRPDWWIDRFIVPGVYVAGSFSGPDLTWFYAIAHPDRLRRIHLYEQTVTNVGVATPQGPDARWTSLASAPDASLYALAVSRSGATSTSTLYTLSAGDGTATRVGDIPAVELDGLAFDADGTLYAIGAGALYTLDRATARATRVGPVDMYEGTTPLAVNQATGQLYRAAQATSGRLLAVDKRTGTETYRGSLPRDLKLAALSFVNDGIGPWARVTPRTGTLPAGGTVTIELELDATQVPRASTYEASLNMEGAFANTPAPIPLTMRIGCATCGGTTGQVSDGTDGRPVVALLRFDDGTTSLETRGSSYAVDLPAGQYVVTATAGGYVPYTGNVTIATGGIVTVHIALDRAERLFSDGFDTPL